MVGVAANSIKNVWSAIEHRHRLAQVAVPLCEPMSFKRAFKAVCAVRSAPSWNLFPVGPHHIPRLLQLVGLSWMQQRAVMITVLGTVMYC